ncbi:MAG: AAA family ATPase [Cyanobacteriota bacterium]|nr:AAA family ATPase [Cyanobacteriota bacterium]
MKIHQIELENFKGFESCNFNFSDNFTLLIGDNGTGKTAILDALAIGAGSLFLAFDEVPSRNILPDEIRVVRHQKGQTITENRQYPVSVTCEGIVVGKKINWTRQILSSEGRTTRSSAREIQEISKQSQQQVRRGEDVLLPVIAYYGTGRLWLQKKEKSVEPVKPGSQMLGYVDCLEPISSHKQLLRWWKTMEMASIQRGEKIRILEAVKAAISNCLEDWKNVTYDLLEDDIVATAKDGNILPFRMLSDGNRNMLGMVADIAYRAGVLNPHLEAESTRQTPGIVLIDEIDLHLHPKWQRRVVEDLRRTFPEIQFFATTHSEHIIQSLRPGELINLDERRGEYYNKSIEDITEDIMGIELPQRSKRWHDMMRAAEEYYGLLQEAKNANPERLKELKIKLDKLTVPFSDDPAYEAFLKMERLAALGEKA